MTYICDSLALKELCLKSPELKGHSPAGLFSLDNEFGEKETNTTEKEENTDDLNFEEADLQKAKEAIMKLYDDEKKAFQQRLQANQEFNQQHSLTNPSETKQPATSNGTSSSPTPLEDKVSLPVVWKMPND